MALKDIFSFLFQRSTSEERVAQYVIREHDRGRPLSEILEDRYVVNRLQSPEQRARLGHFLGFTHPMILSRIAERGPPSTFPLATASRGRQLTSSLRDSAPDKPGTTWDENRRSDEVVECAGQVCDPGSEVVALRSR